MNGAVLWSSGIVVSLAVHGSVIGVLPIWLAPEPIDNEPRPQSEMRIETQDVARSESSAIPPPSENLAQDKATGTAVDQGTIPESRASAEPVKSAALAQTAPPPITAPIAPQSAPVRASTADIAPVLSTAAPDSAPLAAAAIPAQSAVIAAPVTETIAPATNPDAALIPVSATTAAVIAAIPAGDTVLDMARQATQTVAQSIPDPIPVPQGDLHADQITAALAWSGGAGSQIDAQAFATIQSFMQAGDISQQSTQTRDALTDLLAQVPCSRLQAEFDPATGTIALRGHIPEEGLRAPVLAALQAQVGPGLPVVDAMLILPRPQCGSLSGIGAVGLPQSTNQLTDRRLIGADAQARVEDYVAGDVLEFGLAAPDYDAVIYIDYYDADGNVIHLAPNDTTPLEHYPAQTQIAFTAKGPNGDPIRIGPPFGQEIAVAFAASSPLYEGVRPLVEPAEPYLSWLRDQVATARAADADFKGEWVYFFVSTHAE